MHIYFTSLHNHSLSRWIFLSARFNLLQEFVNIHLDKCHCNIPTESEHLIVTHELDTQL